MIIDIEYIERESKKREYREYLENFLRACREYFEKVKRDHKLRAQSENVPRISGFYVNFKEILIIESF